MYTCTFFIWKDLPNHYFAFVNYFPILEKKTGKPAMEKAWMHPNTTIPEWLTGLLTCGIETILPWSLIASPSSASFAFTHAYLTHLPAHTLLTLFFNLQEGQMSRYAQMWIGDKRSVFPSLNVSQVWHTASLMYAITTLMDRSSACFKPRMQCFS